MARQTRRKTRIKRSLPQRRMGESSTFPGEYAFKGREEIKNWKVAVMLTGIFILALFLRVYFNVSEATDDGFKMTGGSDPYYHKRAVDWVITEHEHLIDDPMLNYPIGIPNPRPPVFDWSMALTGIAISPAFGGDAEESTWWAVEFIPALFGALTIIPVYLIGKESFNKRTGILAAFLLAIMAGHIGHTTFGLADHDSFFLFWAVTSIYFFQRSVNCLKDGIWVKDWTRLSDIRYGFQDMVKANQVALGYALFAGMSMSVIALAWKGFPYIMTIIIAYFLFQLLINKVREVDSLNLSFISLTALAMPMALSAPYYALLGFESWWTPPLFMLIAAAMAALVMVPTRKIPWVLVFSGIGLIVFVGYILLIFVFKDFGDLVLSGAQYFVRTKLFDTIAEAQAPTFSRIVFSYGIVSFFLAFFLGIPYIIYQAFKSERKDLMFMLTWAALGAYMAQSAVRFIYNGTPIMAIMAAWIIIEIVDWVDYRKMMKEIRGHSARGDGVADRFKAIYRGTSPRHVLGAILVLGLVVFPNFMDGLDAGIPYEDKKEWDNNIYDFYDATPITDNPVFSMVPEDDEFDRDSTSTWYLGSFGPSFPNGYWLSYFDWLKEEDNNTAPEKRPAFLSWWDYGFWAIQLGEHPTVADNFQTGYQFAGNFIAAEGEEEAVALLIQRLLDTNVRQNGGKFGDEEEKALLKYLDQSNVTDLLDIYLHALDYETHNVSAVNGRIRAMKDLLVGNLTLDELVDIYHDLQVSTGYSIRYFAIDARLFPFSATNNIFYAPVTLADLDVTTYLETLYLRGDDEGNPVGEPMTAEEVELEAERDPNLRIVDTTLEYNRPFFDTMLYKTYIGWDGEDVGDHLDDGIPGVSGDYQSSNIMPGWMMQHFREIYRTFYFNPYPADEVADHQDAWEPMSYQEAVQRGGAQGNISSGMNSGVTSLKYYDGAIVTGQVTTDKGEPVEGIRMTMYDESLIPHHVNYTDENGNYKLIAPFGRASIVASKGPMTTQEEYLLQAGNHILNSTSFNVTDNQAMRLTNWNITQDMEITSGVIEGQVYWDENNDETFSSSADNLVVDPFIVLREIDSNSYYNITPSNDSPYGTYFPETGNYLYEGIPPGEYELSLKVGSHLRTIAYFVDDNSIYPTDDIAVIEVKAQDIAITPASISGTVVYANGTVSERDVVLVDLLDDSERTATVNSGRFFFSYLLNGTYKIRVDGEDIFQEVSPDIEAVENDIEVVNLTLYPAITLTGTTSYDAELKKYTTVYFNSTVAGLSTQVTSDENGEFTIKLASATYDITTAEYVGGKYHASYMRRGFSHSENIAFDMQNTMELSGIVFHDEHINGVYDSNNFNREEVADASVILRGKNFILTTESNGFGRYSFNVPKGRYSLEAVDNETQRTAYEEILFTSNETQDLMLENALRVSGKAVTSGWTGEFGTNLIAGASIEFTSGAESFFTTTDENGAYSIYLPTGDYSALAYAFGYEEILKTFEVLGNETIDFILDPEDVLVEGIASFEGEPMSGVVVEFDDTWETITDENGYYSLILPPKHYLVTFKRFIDENRFFDTTDITLNTGASRVTLNADLEKQLEVSGTVLYNGDDKIGDILFESASYSVSESLVEGDYTTYVIPGSYKVAVNLEGNSYLRLLTIEEPMTLSMDTRDFARVRGYVYNDVDQNERYTGTDDGITSKISFQTPDGFINDTTSSSGYYTLRLFKGTYDVIITSDGYYDFDEKHGFEIDDQYNFLMVPHPIDLTGTVWFDKNGNGDMEGSEAVPYVPVVINVKGDDIAYTTMSNGKGQYSYTLVPGSYRVTAWYTDPEGKNYSRIINTVTVNEGDDTVKQDLNLEIKYEIEGMIRDFLHKVPIKGVELDFLDEHGNTIENFETDEDGTYRVVIREGTYTIHARKIQGDRTLVLLEKVTIDTSQIMDLELITGVRFTGTLYSGDIKNTIDIGRIDLLAPSGITLNTYSSDSGEFEFLIPAGRYEMQGDITDTELTPDTDFILDVEVNVAASHNYEEYNIDLEAKKLYGFTWDVDEKIKNAYIGYTGNKYLGPEFVFSITNTGNTSESVALTYEFDNKTYWQNANLMPDTIDIKPGETKEVIFRTKPVDSIPVNRRTVVTINASVTDEETISREMEITLVAKKSKVGDAQIEYIKRTPSWDITEGEEFTLSAEIVNPVEFSENINVTAIFERQTKSEQWEVIEKYETTVAYRSDKTVSHVITEDKAGKHTYRVRLVPSVSSQESDPNNNAATIVVEVQEKPEETLDGWQGTINFINEEVWLSNLILFILIVVIGGSTGMLYAKKRGKRGRRYKRRHSR